MRASRVPGQFLGRVLEVSGMHAGGRVEVCAACVAAGGRAAGSAGCVAPTVGGIDATHTQTHALPPQASKGRPACQRGNRRRTTGSGPSRLAGGQAGGQASKQAGRRARTPAGPRPPTGLAAGASGQRGGGREGWRGLAHWHIGRRWRWRDPPPLAHEGLLALVAHAPHTTETERHPSPAPLPLSPITGTPFPHPPTSTRGPLTRIASNRLCSQPGLAFGDRARARMCACSACPSGN